MNFYHLSALALFLTLLSACGGKNVPERNEQLVADSLAIVADSLDGLASDSALIKKFGVDNTELDYAYKPASINLFLLEMTNRDNIAFSSFSDVYSLSENLDSLAIPSLKGMNADEASSIVLTSKYRNQFLNATHISEFDSVFVYDYEHNKLHSFLVKDLKAVANLSTYDYVGVDGDLSQLSQYSYRIGFEFDGKVLQPTDEYYQHTLVYVGKANPFALEQLMPIKWEKIEDSRFPNRKIHIDDVPRFVGATTKYTYLFQKFDLEYFIQVYVHTEYGNEVSRLIVLDKKTGNMITDEVFGSFEGSEPKPLNFIEGENSDIMQWTGKLLKGSAPVVFGFEYASFGCSSLVVLDKQKSEQIYFNCDNRH